MFKFQRKSTEKIFNDEVSIFIECGNIQRQILKTILLGWLLLLKDRRIFPFFLITNKLLNTSPIYDIFVRPNENQIRDKNMQKLLLIKVITGLRTLCFIVCRISFFQCHMGHPKRPIWMVHGDAKGRAWGHHSSRTLWKQSDGWTDISLKGTYFTKIRTCGRIFCFFGAMGSGWESLDFLKAAWQYV